MMSTQTLAEGSRLLALLLMDEVQILNVGDPVTTGTQVTRELTDAGEPVPALVQATSLANTAEGRTLDTWSVKVHQGQPLVAGQAVRVLRCQQEPTLVGRVLLLDKVSENGAAVIRKAIASTTTVVNQEGKEALA